MFASKTGTVAAGQPLPLDRFNLHLISFSLEIIYVPLWKPVLREGGNLLNKQPATWRVLPNWNLLDLSDLLSKHKRRLLCFPRSVTFQMWSEEDAS